jgi:hypothetical protein
VGDVRVLRREIEEVGESAQVCLVKWRGYGSATLVYQCMKPFGRARYNGALTVFDVIGVDQ